MVLADLLVVCAAVKVPKPGLGGRTAIGDLKVVPVCRIHCRAADWTFHSCCGYRELARGFLKRLHFNKILKGLRIFSGYGKQTLSVRTTQIYELIFRVARGRPASGGGGCAAR